MMMMTFITRRGEGQGRTKKFPKHVWTSLRSLQVVTEQVKRC